MGIWIGDRISTEDHADSTTVIIYPKLQGWKRWLLTVWVVGFTFIGGVMIYLLAGGVYSLEVVGDNVEDIRDQQLVYLIVFLGFWMYFEYKTVKALLWYSFGKEFIKLDRDALSHKRAILGYGKSVRYFYENMKDMHLFKSDNTSFGQFFENAYWSLGTDAVIFTYFTKDKSFGRRLDEKTGKLLIRFIEDRIKTLRKKK
ncbi:MAG: hypothetical protein HYZ14_13575 [Bacteroidetes bacterium]|nr:hypothetical protein [Bacteroidota bacterium]